MAAPVAAVAGLAALPVGAGPTLCPFALLTGVACPGCGMTRAAASLVRGEWALAWSFHPLVLVVAAWLVGAWLAVAMRRSGRSAPLSARTTNHLLIATAVLFVAVWLVRMATGALPPV